MVNNGELKVILGTYCLTDKCSLDRFMDWSTSKDWDCCKLIRPEVMLTTFSTRLQPMKSALTRDIVVFLNRYTRLRKWITQVNDQKTTSSFATDSYRFWGAESRKNSQNVPSRHPFLTKSPTWYFKRFCIHFIHITERWNTNMMADFCWLLLEETPDEKYAEQRTKRSIQEVKKWAHQKIHWPKSDFTCKLCWPISFFFHLLNFEIKIFWLLPQWNEPYF